MEENQTPDANTAASNNNNTSNNNERTEPVRSRWTPKPEQILILESIFNSGMVNPPKDETVRIRKLLEKFGAVGDANVFYWFQNRRSRSRRRQRQMQATLAEEQSNRQAQVNSPAIQYDGNPSNCSIGFVDPLPPVCVPTAPSSYLVGASSSRVEDSVDSLFSVPNHMGFPDQMEQTYALSSILCSPDTSNFHCQTGCITVFINGVATEVPNGPIDIKAMFGQDVVLVHSSGVPVLTNDFGFLMQNLQHGESYFLVSRPT